MINRELLQKYKDLADDIRTSYDKIKVVDNFDWNRTIPYTIFYVNKNVEFSRVNKLWLTVREEAGQDATYDEILDMFLEKAEADDMDIVEIGTLDTYTDNLYELEI